MLTVEGRELRVKDGPTLDLECAARGWLTREKKMYIACGPDGLVVVDIRDPSKPAIEKRVPTQGDAIGVSEENGEVVVQTDKKIPLEKLEEPKREKKRPRVVFVDLPEPKLPSSPARKPWSPPTWLAPPRVEEAVTLGAEARGFIPIGASGGGVFLGAEVTYRAHLAFAIRARLAPLALGFAKEGNILATVATGLVSVDSHLLELGFGAGGSTVNDVVGPTPGVVLATFLRWAPRTVSPERSTRGSRSIRPAPRWVGLRGRSVHHAGPVRG